MKNNSFILTRVLLKNSLGKSKRKKLAYLGYGLLAVYFAASVFFTTREILDTLANFRQTTYFVGLVIMLNMTLPIVQSIITSLNVLYFSKDNASLLPLPVKPRDILAAKINIILAYNLVTNFILGILPLVFYGIFTSQGFLFYPVAILTIMAVPVIPVLLGILVNMVIMYLLRNMKNKHTVQTIVTFISFIALIIFSYLIGSATADMAALAVNLLRAEHLIETLKGIIPTLTLAINAVLNQNILLTLALIAVSVACYLLVIQLCQKLFLKGMVGALYSSDGISHKKLDEKSAYKSKSLWKSYVSNEIKIYLRTPAYVINLLTGALILPLLMVGSFYFSLKNEDSVDVFGYIFMLFEDREILGIISCGIMAAMFFFNSYSFISMVAVSKDGRSALFTKSIPVNFYKQIIYKALPDIMMTTIVNLLIIVPLVVLFKFPLDQAAIITLLMIPYSLCHGGLILLDLRKPNLNWDNEVQLVKRNFRILISIAVGFFNTAWIVIALLCDVEAIIIYAIVFVVYTILAGVLFVYIKNKDFELARNIM